MTGHHSYCGLRVLITGGLGFIGSNLAESLVGHDAQVTLVDSLIPEYGGKLFNIDGITDRVADNVSDVRDSFAMRYLVQGLDILFNRWLETYLAANGCNDPEVRGAYRRAILRNRIDRSKEKVRGAIHRLMVNGLNSKES